ncbi:ABC transporter ATP-binding protein [Chloroflexi bacterium TSY]|nr:ABC transporter ATP-binding protein [Chloroflexi bacterium TSY]
MPPIVQTQNLSKEFKHADGTPVHAAKDVNLTIEEGEIFSLLGPNGAGKTTTISMISGLVEPSSGDASIGGFSITKQPIEAKKLMGFIPQEIALYPELSARQNLTFFGQMYGMSGATLNKRVDEVLEFIDLTDRQKDRIDTYSGGMKRRVNIGVGLLHHPQLVYMDEPTVGIDPQSRRILDTVKQLRDEYNMTVLYTTHLMEEAQELSDRVGIIDHGAIIALGTQHELTQRVGEEDRLEFIIGEQSASDSLLAQLQSQVVRVSKITFDPPEQFAEGSSDSVPGRITAFAKEGRRALPELIQGLADAGIEIQSVQVKEPDLEAVFLALTGRALRD